MNARAIVAAAASGILMWLAAPAVGLGWLAWAMEPARGPAGDATVADGIWGGL
jgi:hypothetical protein